MYTVTEMILNRIFQCARSKTLHPSAYREQRTLCVMLLCIAMIISNFLSSLSYLFSIEPSFNCCYCMRLVSFYIIPFNDMETALCECIAIFV